MQERLNAQQYDPKVIQELVDDFGVDESTALLMTAYKERGEI